MSALPRLVHSVREKHFERWLLPYFAQRARAQLTPAREGTGHVLFALCDHYEPLWGGADETTGHARVAAWREGYARLADQFRDADGRPPRHSFFFPGEEIRPGFLEPLAELTALGVGEVELHLHHHDSSEAQLREELALHLGQLAERGHLSRQAGRLRYAFIHGNWALANSRPDGRHCGVDSELQVLHETGCYADYTFPSVPDPTQPPIVNTIYWPTGNLARRAAHEEGLPAVVGTTHDDRPLMIQGPLAMTLRDGGHLPRLEYGALTAKDPPTASRVRSWVEQNIAIQGQPEWVFVKVYCHGAGEEQARAMLGEGGRMLHENLARSYNDGRHWKLHYVTAREMYNIAIAAMAGKRGDPNDYRDHVLPPPPAAG